MRVKPLFKDRRDAGQQLARALTRFQIDQPIALALPRGGVPVGFEIAQSLKAALNILLVRKIGVPGMPELAAGAVVDGAVHQTVWNEKLIQTLRLDRATLEAQKQMQLREIERRRQIYPGAQRPCALSGRNIVIVDDGIATGSTIQAALIALRRADVKTRVIAVPVAPKDVWKMVLPAADRGVCLFHPEPFGAVGQYYRNFEQLEDKNVIDLLAHAR